MLFVLYNCDSNGSKFFRAGIEGASIIDRMVRA